MLRRFENSVIWEAKIFKVLGIDIVTNAKVFLASYKKPLLEEKVRRE